MDQSLNECINQVYIEFSELCASERKQILSEGAILTGLAGLGVATMLFGKDNVLSFARSIIDSLIKIIQFAMEQFRKLWKWLTVHASDIYRSNTLFIQKYGAKLTAMQSTEVYLDGYNMDADIMSLVNNLTVESRTSNNDVGYISDILTGNSPFKTKDDVALFVNKNRADILAVDIIGSKYPLPSSIRSDSDFSKALTERLYGTKHTNVYTIGECLNTIKNYNTRIESITSANKIISDYGNQELDNLVKLKAKFTDGNFVVKDVDSKLISMHFNWLIEYKQKVLNDYFTAFQIMIQYTNDINTQAKAICIKALQDN